MNLASLTRSVAVRARVWPAANPYAQRPEILYPITIASFENLGISVIYYDYSNSECPACKGLLQPRPGYGLLLSDFRGHLLVTASWDPSYHANWDSACQGIGGMPLRVHVPKQYILWPSSSPYIGTLGPKSILFGYMDP